MGRTIQVAELDLAPLQLFLQQTEHSRELAEHEEPVPTVEALVEQFAKELQFARIVGRGFGFGGCRVGLFGVEEAQVAANLPQAQQRCEDHHPALSQSVGLDGRIDLLAGRRQDLRIHLGLGRCEIAVGDVLKLGGQFL